MGRTFFQYFTTLTKKDEGLERVASFEAKYKPSSNKEVQPQPLQSFVVRKAVYKHFINRFNCLPSGVRFTEKAEIKKQFN